MVSAPGNSHIQPARSTIPVQPNPSAPPSNLPNPSPQTISYRLPEVPATQDKAVYGPPLTQPSAQTNLSFIDEFDVPEYASPKGESLGRRLGLTHDLDIQGLDNATLKFAPFKVKLHAEF